MTSVIDQLKDVDPSKSYRIGGAQINLRNSILRALWRGDHIITSGAIRKGQQHTAGCALTIDLPDGTVAEQDFTPFEIFSNKHFVDGVWDNTYDVTLYPGAINQLVPTNIFATINQAITTTLYVVLTVQSNGLSITSSSWSLMSSQPTPSDATADAPPSTFYVTIGIIFFASPSISLFQLVTDDLTAAPVIWTTTTRAGAGPYEMASMNYYTWYVE